MAGFIVTPTRPTPSMQRTAGTRRSASRANPARKTVLSSRPAASTGTVCRSARRPTTLLPTTVAAPYAISRTGTVPAEKPVTSVRIGLK
jgi:hypothetical protein